MLWIVTPQSVRILNAFQPPEEQQRTTKHPAELLSAATDDLAKLRAYELDRISLESGQFWETARGRRIKKSDRIDTKLAEDLEGAGKILVELGCKPLAAHRLMLRTLFTAYLEARGVLPRDLFKGLKANSFGDVLKDSKKTTKFFERMRDTFNGDLFPPPPKSDEGEDDYVFAADQLEVARRIVVRQDMTSGQQSFDFWRYDFEVIPIELISSIYERFIYADDAELAKKLGTHYTPVNLVDLVFSQVLDDSLFDAPLPDKPKVLDLTCGSGVFLVEAFRRMVARRVAAGEKLTRTLVRDVLSNQLFGVDLQETAIEIAAFSLCLTAFELDPSPSSVNQLKFRHSLKGRNLFVGDAFEANRFMERKEFKEKQFSIVVGNPPWNKPRGERSTRTQSSISQIDYCKSREPPIELPFRSPIDQAFIWRSCEIAHENGRIGLILDGKNFFSQKEQSLKAKRMLLGSIRSRVLLNLAALHNKKLFPTAEQPAMIYVAENTKPEPDDNLVLASAERSESFPKHGIIELHVERVHQLPVEKVISDPHLLKTASYGTARDHAIVSRLYGQYGTIEQFARGLQSHVHLGFKRNPQVKLVPDEVRELPMLENRELNRWLQLHDELPQMQYDQLEAPRALETYLGPICLVQQKLKDDRLLAAVSKESVAYSQSYFGVPNLSLWQAKYLAAVVNSAMAAYCFFLTSSRFGVERYFAAANDIARLPIPIPENRSECEPLLREFDRRAKSGDSDGFDSLDEAVFDYFGVNPWDREYIADVVKYDLDFVRHGSRADAVKPADDEVLECYAKSLVASVRSNLYDSDVIANAEILTGLDDVCAVVVRFDQSTKRKVGRVSADQFSAGTQLANLLYAPFTSTTQLRRSLLKFEDERCIIVKHAQRRFWSRARAQDDADSIFTKLLEPVAG